MANNLEITVELVVPPDYEAAGAVVVGAYRELLGEMLDDEYAAHLGDVAGRARISQVYVAKLGSEIVGSVTYVNDPASPMAEGLHSGEVEIRMLAVKPKQQGRGLGRMLAETCVRLGEQDGADALFLHSTQYMAAAHRLYASLGFVRLPDRDWQISPEVLLMAFRKVLTKAT